VVASPAVHPFLEFDFYSLSEYRPVLRAKFMGSISVISANTRRSFWGEIVAERPATVLRTWR
jgi:hypothetical protein